MSNTNVAQSHYRTQTKAIHSVFVVIVVICHHQQLIVNAQYHNATIYLSDIVFLLHVSGDIHVTM